MGHTGPQAVREVIERQRRERAELAQRRRAVAWLVIALLATLPVA